MSCIDPGTVGGLWPGQDAYTGSIHYTEWGKPVLYCYGTMIRAIMSPWTILRLSLSQRHDAFIRFLVDGDDKQIWRIAYLLTPWSRVLLEKLTGSAASQEIPRIFGPRRFLTVPTSARHLSLSWANSIQSPQPPPTSWRSILILSSHLRLGLPNGLFCSGFPTRTLCTNFPSHIRATLPTYTYRKIKNLEWNSVIRLTLGLQLSHSNLPLHFQYYFIKYNV